VTGTLTSELVAEGFELLNLGRFSG
jgi:hypothetical protein